LQNVATRASGFVLQTIGYPTYREGHTLHCQDHTLGVEQACNGLSMLLTFVTLSVGMVMVIRRPWLDRIIILLSAMPIAILSNVIRIAVTGVLYNEAGKELGDKVFHDFAGWMMMPLALGMMLVVLKVLDWVLQEDLGKASREEVIRNVTAKPAYLFMPAFEKAQTNGGKLPPAPGPSR
jgi:exosortase